MSQFVITSVGNAAASAASPTGPWVNIVEFRIGTDYATPADVFDTDLKGGTLYSAPPSSYSRLDTDTIGIRCELPANVGPFEFGEIGLYMPDGVLFARASFGKPQQKLVGTVAGIPNTWRFTAVLKFTQAPALFMINTSSQNQLLEVADFSLLSAPSLMPGSPNAAIVHEPTPWGESPMLWKSNSNRWSIGKHSLLTIDTITESTTTTIRSAAFSTLGSALTRQYLIQFQNGDIRAVLGFIGDEAQLSYPTVERPVGEAIEIFKADSPSFSAPNLTAADYNQLATMVNLTVGPPSGTSLDTMRGWGQTEIPMAAPGLPPTDWPLLVDRVSRAASLLRIPNDFPLNTLQHDWSTDLASQLVQYSTLVNLVRQIRGSTPNQIPMDRTESEVASVVTRSSSYVQIHHDVDVTFSSEDAAKAFFNSGGWIGFSIEMNEDNMVQTLQRWRLAQLGIIRMAALKSESTGSLRIQCDVGDGVIADEGNCGFYGAFESRQKMWSHMLPVPTAPGTETDTGYVLFELYATQPTSSTLKLEFQITDNTGLTYSNATNSPPFSITSSCLSGIPDTSIVQSPVIERPVISTSVSTSW
jgi:hypothetical protein